MISNFYKLIIVFLIAFLVVNFSFAQQEPPNNPQKQEKDFSDTIKTENQSQAPTIKNQTINPANKNIQKQKPMTDIHDIKPALDLGVNINFLYYILYIFLFIIAALIIWIIFKMIKNKKKKEHLKDIQIRPEENAYKCLENLSKEKNLDGKEFYFQLSAIFRSYIKDRYLIDALEMTSEEFIPILNKLSIDKVLKNKANNFVNYQDPIKFAKQPTNNEKMKNDFDFVKVFVKNTTIEQSQEQENHQQTKKGLKS